MARIPTSRLGRSARLGGLVAGRGAGYAAARLRGGEERWATETAEQLVLRLGEMKGLAMKLGQMLSTVDFEAVPPEDRERFKARLGALRDQAPAADLADVRRVVEDELGAPLERHFAHFSARPVAAASIGQVHRATTTGGRDVAVKVQYPRIAEAVETDLRGIGLVVPLVRALAPGVDARVIVDELRARIGEELDYEIEAQHQRQVARAFRGHPFVRIPEVDTALSTRRVLVSEFIEGDGFEAIKARPEPERDRVGEILFRMFYGLLRRERLCVGDPHPGNQLLCPDGRVCFLDFGLMRRVPEWFLAGERELAQAVAARDPAGVHRAMEHLGYLPDPGRFTGDGLMGQLLASGEWLFVPGFRRLDPGYVRQAIERGSTPRSEWFGQMRRQTVPAEALLIRRMEQVLFSVLGELRAGADWGALAAEHFAGAAPSTDLGRAEAAWLSTVR
jgi:predicted unusual protein kinase regulating ubiquinone biosynthesis (AarF/ABC1/UbiB family)